MAYSNFGSLYKDIQNQGISTNYFYYGWDSLLPSRMIDAMAISFKSPNIVPLDITEPTTAVVCDKNTGGAINKEFPNFSPLNNYIIKFTLSTFRSDNCYVIITDRLSHQGGLVINTSTPQTTNLPTAALTRYTDGVGVMIGVTAYDLLVGSATITVSYTNQSNVSGRNTVVQPIGIDLFEFRILQLQDGDYGVRSIESVTIGNPSVSTGNIGLCLFKPICMFGTNGISNNQIVDYDFISGNLLGGIPSFNDNACLFPIIGSRGIGESGSLSSIGGEMLTGVN